jgi:hypothetical protein
MKSSPLSGSDIAPDLQSWSKTHPVESVTLITGVILFPSGMWSGIRKIAISSPDLVLINP